MIFEVDYHWIDSNESSDMETMIVDADSSWTAEIEAMYSLGVVDTAYEIVSVRAI